MDWDPFKSKKKSKKILCKFTTIFYSFKVTKSSFQFKPFIVHTVKPCNANIPCGMQQGISISSMLACSSSTLLVFSQKKNAPFATKISFFRCKRNFFPTAFIEIWKFLHLIISLWAPLMKRKRRLFPCTHFSLDV